MILGLTCPPQPYDTGYDFWWEFCAFPVSPGLQPWVGTCSSFCHIHVYLHSARLSERSCSDTYTCFHSRLAGSALAITTHMLPPGEAAAAPAGSMHLRPAPAPTVERPLRTPEKYLPWTCWLCSCWPLRATPAGAVFMCQVCRFGRLRVHSTCCCAGYCHCCPFIRHCRYVRGVCFHEHSSCRRRDHILWGN